MKRPGDTRQRPPGGGAAGRAQQFDTERQPAGQDPKQSEEKETEESSPSKGTTKKRAVKPK
jgi:hypothetical protein